MNRGLREEFDADQPALASVFKEAANRRRLKAVPALLEQGMDVNQADYNGNTLLILAAIEGDPALANLLIIKGADTQRRNRGGNTALVLALMNKHEDIAQMLRKAPEIRQAAAEAVAREKAQRAALIAKRRTLRSMAQKRKVDIGPAP